MRSVAIFALSCVAGCGPSHPDVIGPFTYTTYRLVVDGWTLPIERTDYANDLTGRGEPYNQLGILFGALAEDNDVTTATGDMLASGAFSPVLEITSDDPSSAMTPPSVCVSSGRMERPPT